MNNSIYKNNELEFLKDITENGRVILSIGAKNSGKTYVMNSFLKYALFYNLFEFYHCIIPAFKNEQNDSYAFLKDQKHVNIYKTYDPRISKNVDRDRQKGKTLFILDDSTSGLLNNIDPTLLNLIITSRHIKGCTIWIIVHGAKRCLTPLIRSNVEHLFIYRITNNKLLYDLFEEYYSMIFEKYQDFKNFYVQSTTEQFSCIHYTLNFIGIDNGVKYWNFVVHNNYDLPPVRQTNQTKQITTEKNKEHKPKQKTSLTNFIFGL